MLKAIIFDMDGVIVDTEPQHLRAMVQAGAELGATFISQYCEKFIGLNFHDTFEILSHDHTCLTDSQLFMQVFSKYKYKIKEEEGLIPIVGTIRLIKSLHKHNIKVAIASSSDNNEIDYVVNAFGLSEYIDERISGKMVLHSKPEPDIFLLAADTLAVSADECIVIEDSKNGSIAAMKAGIPCIGYQNKNSGNQDLSRTVCIYEDMMALDYDAVLEEYNRYHLLPVDILNTKRLIIRELTLDNIKDLKAIYDSKKVTAYIPGLSPLEDELEKHAAYIKNVYNFYRFGLWGIFRKDTDELIGRAGLQCIDIDDITEIELGYLIAPDYQRQGYAYECCKDILTYAKEYLCFPSVVAVIHPDNQASIALAKRLGFTYERSITWNNTPAKLFRIHLL